MRYQLVTAGQFSGVDLQDARLHLKIPSNITAEDGLIREYIAAASKYIEVYTNRVIATSTWAGYLDSWPDPCIIRINKNPVTSISSVQYYDGDDVLQTLDSSLYSTDTVGYPARIYIDSPPAIKEKLNAIKINFVAGHSSMATVDARIQQAVRLLITASEQDRTSYVKGNIVSELPFGFKNYVQQLTINEF